jgi:DNA-binding response OmpR family regulator
VESISDTALDAKAFSQGSAAVSARANAEAEERAGLPHILVVDDDPAIRQLLSEYLSGSDLRVTAVPDGAAMRAALGSGGIDLILLDLGTGAEDGIDLASRLRGESAIPVVMLSSRTDEADRVMALELGADDYVTKPFSPRELLARVRAILRRRRRDIRQARARGLRAYRFDRWELNLKTRLLHSPPHRPIALSNGEFNVLAVLLQAGGRVLSRTQVLELSRLHDDEVYDRAVDVQIMRLRRKLERNGFDPHWIVTVRGAGYRIGVPVESVY